MKLHLRLQQNFLSEEMIKDETFSLHLFCYFVRILTGITVNLYTVVVFCT